MHSSPAQCQPAQPAQDECLASVRAHCKQGSLPATLSSLLLLDFQSLPERDEFDAIGHERLQHFRHAAEYMWIRWTPLKNYKQVSRSKWTPLTTMIKQTYLKPSGVW